MPGLKWTFWGQIFLWGLGLIPGSQGAPKSRKKAGIRQQAEKIYPEDDEGTSHAPHSLRIILTDSTILLSNWDMTHCDIKMADGLSLVVDDVQLFIHFNHVSQGLKVNLNITDHHFWVRVLWKWVTILKKKKENREKITTMWKKWWENTASYNNIVFTMSQGALNLNNHFPKGYKIIFGGNFSRFRDWKCKKCNLKRADNFNRISWKFYSFFQVPYLQPRGPWGPIW